MVVDSGSLTAASERLGFTQSALSKQIAALEDATGTRLLIRRPRGVEPTEAGQRLAARAASILDQLDAAARELALHTPGISGRIALGAFPAAAMQLVPKAIARLRLDHPSIEVEFLESSTQVQLRRLRAGRLDLAILAAGADLPDADTTGIDLEAMPSGRLLIAVSERHELANSARIDVQQLAKESWIAGTGAPGEPQFGAWPTLRDPQIAVRLSEWSARLGFVAAGLGITTVPSLMADALPRGIKTLEVLDPDFRGRSMYFARIGSPSSAGAALRAALFDEAASIAAV